MTKCLKPSCLEPALQEGLCEAHFEHEQRIRAVEARIEAELTKHGDKGGVLRTPQSLMPPVPKKRRTEPVPCEVKPIVKPRIPQAPVCQVAFCGEPQDDLGLCLACKSSFLLWRRYHLVGLASPMTPSPQQVLIFQRLQSEWGSPPSVPSPQRPPRQP